MIGKSGRPFFRRGHAKARLRGHSSAGRALAWHARGRRFDPAWLHQPSQASPASARQATLNSIVAKPAKAVAPQPVRAKADEAFAAYSPTTAFNRSRSATISSLTSDNSATEHDEASRIDS